mmetsp:Transcript_65994/g.197177  ORF Transcript_65994/g.197177 Transcript_65994/m.197177 type:complete len:150 (+) Transcript_65994:3-452(+)
MLLFFVTVAFGVLLAWLLLRSERVRAAYEVHSNYFGSVLGEQDMGAFSGEGAGYTWTQTNAEVEIAVPVAASARAKDVRCQVTASTLSLVCSGTQILQGRLFRGVEADDCDWKIEDASGGARVVTVTLVKSEATRGNQHWTSVLQLHPG